MSVIPVIEEGRDQEPIYAPRPLPPTPTSIAIIDDEFTFRSRSREFDRKSFLAGVFVTSWFFLILGLIVVSRGG